MPIFISSIAALSIAMSGAPAPAVRNAPAVSARSIEVRRGKKLVARIWLAAGKDPKACGDRDRVNFCELGVGSAVGVIRFLEPWRDSRDQEVPAATYLLRYVIQPRLKDHLDTTPYRDFLMLEPSPGNAHPFVMALVPAHSTGRPVLRDAVIETDIAGVRVGLTLQPDS